MKDFLEQLAEQDVAPPPPEFDRQLHQRVNQSLTGQHLIDFAAGAAPWALLHFVGAALCLLVPIFTGKFDDKRRDSL